MFKNYFKISFRNMRRHKVYASINIAGLSVGITCFLLIFLYVQDELSYDRYHNEAKDIYRIVVPNYDADGELSRVFSYASLRHGELLRNDFPQIESVVRFNPFNFPIIKYQDKQFEEAFFNLVEPSIFDVFTFNFIEGEAKDALVDPFSVVITQSTAEKYFGTEKALGKTLNVLDGREFLFKVTGVIEDFPEQSHMSYNFLGSWATFESTVDLSTRTSYYGNYNYPTYLKVKNGVNIEVLSEQIPALLDKYIDNIQGDKASSRLGLTFQRLTDIHLKGTPGTSGTPREFYLYLFSAVGFLVLLIGCINYMNLATAKYANRLKEIGVRKVMGAGSSSISQQFLVESISYTTIALILSIGLAYLLLPTLNTFTEKSLSLELATNLSLYLFLIGLVFFVGLLAGSYPAFFMSRFKTVSALKNGKLNIKNRSFFRMGMVIFQFVITISLVIGVIVVDRQLSFIRNQYPGFERKQVITFSGNAAMNNQSDIFKTRLLNNPKIQQSAMSTRVPTGRLADSMDATLLDGELETNVDFRLPFIRADRDFLKLYEIDLITGENLPDKIPANDNQSFILNETAVMKLGWTNPEEAIGKRMRYGFLTGFIKGVVKDFHFESLHSSIQPMIFYNTTRAKRIVSVKISPTDMPETLTYLEDIFKEYSPDRSFDASFLDDDFNRQYEDEKQLSDISKIFSVLAIFIACIGLLGLVSFTLEQKAKEISVRKVLGASVTGILLLVNRSYAVLILIAFAIAVPLSIYALDGWLSSFAYHISIGVGIISVAGIMTATLAVITICSQAIRFATANPVKWLRNE
ncbi:hypothetical protein BFP71_02015 [Roseivirga misakiensis]|uniref:ABC transporter permease n=2 Tax=Roseivirga misakiensis TaxID=1563681 RepID=A0A1E5T7D7_9BACT|nr:hypothetical protein BFP71_02015 [Roseivirga misakiensis]